MFSAIISCSLSLNSLAICAYRVLNISKGSATKSSYVAPSYSPSYTLGRHILISVTKMNWCWVPFGSIIVLYIVDVIATYGVWQTNAFSFVICTSIVCFNASYTDVNVVISFVILSQTLSAMVVKSSSFNTAWYLGFDLFLFFLGVFLVSIVLGRFSLIFTFPLSFSLASSLSFTISFYFSFPLSFSFSFFSFGFSLDATHSSRWSLMTCFISSCVIR